MTTNSGESGRRRSIRYPILAIAWIPSLVLLLIGASVAGVLGYQGAQTRSYKDQFTATSQTAAVFTVAVFEERRLSETAVLTRDASGAELTAARAKLDASIPPLMTSLKSIGTKYPEAYGSFITYLGQLPSRLPGIRQRVSNGQAGLVDVSEFYSGITSAVTKNLFDTSRTQPVPEAAVEATISVVLLRGTDELLDADALAVAAFAAPNGLSDAEFELLARRYGGSRSRFVEAAALLEPASRQQLTALQQSTAWRQLENAHQMALRTRVADRGTDQEGTSSSGTPVRTSGRPTRPTPPMDPRTWGASTGAVVQGITAINLAQSTYSSQISARQGAEQLRRSVIVGVALLLLAVLVFLVTTTLSNRLVRRLRRLRSETLAMAHERLPSIVGRLRDGQPVDVQAEMPPLQFGRDEIGQVAEAFDESQRMAVAAAAREAETRAGLRTVFLDIAHRSQAIVHRQLKVLDQAERAQEDPDQLALLFQLDHLSTRARRNAENLIVLGGGQAGRQWRNPVPLIEITRSAISEAEDYVRVQIAGLPRVAIQGAAVADLIHLLAELVDNATSFSPPMSRVEVRGNLVGRGVVLEVEDQGLGIEPDQMNELNRLLHEPPDFQVMALADEPRLGLFVVSQLAYRHGIRVTLTPSPAYGGTRVVVLLPTTVLATDPALDVPRDGSQPSLPQPTALGTSGQPSISPSISPSIPAARPMSLPPSAQQPLVPPAPTPLSAVPPVPPEQPEQPERPGQPVPPAPAAFPGPIPFRPSPAPPVSAVPPVPEPWDAPLEPSGSSQGSDRNEWPAPTERPARADGVPVVPEPGLFDAPLRETGLFEAPSTQASVVDLRPYDEYARRSASAGPAHALPRRMERSRRMPPGSDATQPHRFTPESGLATPEPGPVRPEPPAAAEPGPGHPEPGPAQPQPGGDGMPLLDRPERVIALLTDESFPAPTSDPSVRPELPRRTRQAHLSPKLREVPGVTTIAPVADAELPDADEARSRMSALQRGTLRGRATDPET